MKIKRTEKKGARYSKSLFNGPSRAVSTHCRRRNVSPQSSLSVDD
jgi:hypothetical protein